MTALVLVVFSRRVSGDADRLAVADGRFPLRSSASPLSDTVYTTSRVTQLLANFELDAELNLIFLRHVERLEIYERPRGSAEPLLRYRVQVWSANVGTWDTNRLT